ncbi:predicted protein [Uncinocarpus reesii 1704]|uniref:Uncharacterized protein n=1 Tax=Uncinocarpus reesii (strain UAMH 1704) TaxID=336963 RepID=C4JST6_UNCRE|nr:uncharacterized protein UREG_05525 [Uncinocarpus reesii 1704]EEP80683.1 predicted protein [Uncinocarpus reesii 1704]
MNSRDSVEYHRRAWAAVVWALAPPQHRRLDPGLQPGVVSACAWSVISPALKATGCIRGGLAGGVVGLGSEVVPGMAPQLGHPDSPTAGQCVFARQASGWISGMDPAFFMMRTPSTPSVWPAASTARNNSLR